MTNQEAIKYIENHGYISDDVKDIAIKALEKQIPKKPIYSRLYATTPDMNCPVCNATLLTDEPNYCKRCGQKFNWGDEEE